MRSCPGQKKRSRTKEGGNLGLGLGPTHGLSVFVVKRRVRSRLRVCSRVSSLVVPATSSLSQMGLPSPVVRLRS